MIEPMTGKRGIKRMVRMAKPIPGVKGFDGAEDRPGAPRGGVEFGILVVRATLHATMAVGEKDEAADFASTC
mgnify:CR=1 FL=1